MKKSKIILPAVTLLTISTVAAASSTVAWFTASRTVNVEVSEVAVYNPESNLNVTLSTVANSGATTTDKKVTMPKYMRDGSVDAANGKVYKKDVVAETYEALADNTYFTDTALITGETGPQNIYRATSWKMTFSMVGAAADDYAVLIDMTNTVTNFKRNDDEASSKDAKKISESFRIAFVAGDQVTVLAPWATEENLTYVTNNAKGNYKDNKVTVTGKAISSAEIASTDKNTKLTAANGYVGTIAKSTDAETASELEVTCYAWFEGEDPACVVPTGAINTKVSSILGFYAVRVTTAA